MCIGRDPVDELDVEQWRAAARRELERADAEAEPVVAPAPFAAEPDEGDEPDAAA